MAMKQPMSGRTEMNAPAALTAAAGIILSIAAAFWLTWKILALVIPLIVGQANAHTAASGQDYSTWCCSGRDCQPAAQGWVSATPDGYLVNIPEGQHVTGFGIYTLVPYDDGRIRFATDGAYHVCLTPLFGSLRCLYVPEYGA